MIRRVQERYHKLLSSRFPTPCVRVWVVEERERVGQVWREVGRYGTKQEAERVKECGK